jgi:phage tail protein X
MNRYQNIPQTKIDGKVVYKTSRYPEIPLSPDDIYVYTVQGDRFDILAQQFYQDSSLWWVISIANANILNQSSLVIPGGIQIRIPASYIDVVRSFNSINQ